MQSASTSGYCHHLIDRFLLIAKSKTLLEVTLAFVYLRKSMPSSISGQVNKLFRWTGQRLRLSFPLSRLRDWDLIGQDVSGFKCLQLARLEEAISRRGEG
jgi:hypothetical protein